MPKNLDKEVISYHIQDKIIVNIYEEYNIYR
jgi:hypothetical protein